MTQKSEFPRAKEASATKWRKALTLIFRARHQLVVDPAVHLLPGHKHVADHSVRRLGRLVVGQPNDPVDLTHQPGAEGDKDAKGGSHSPVSDGRLKDMVVQTQLKQMENSCLLFQINQEVQLYHGF